MVERLDVATALAEAARSMNSAHTLEEILDRIVHSALASLAGIDHIGISFNSRGGRIETMAATDQFVWELDEIQYEFHEGPCIHAIENEPVVIVENARLEPRWAKFMPRAVERGLRSQLAVKLFSDEKTHGGLNMYSTSSDTIDPETVHTAELFAIHAALALGHARVRDERRVGIAGVIGMACGLVMAKHQIDRDRAFQFLARVSQTSNIKLRDVAQEVVDEANTRFRPPGSLAEQQ